MGRKKQERFAEGKKLNNLIQEGKEKYTQVKGKWNSIHFPKAQPIVLELACGYGEYSVGLGSVYPNKNFIGIDIKGDRLWKGCSEALAANLTNVAFLRTQIQQLEDFFEENEVDEIWIVHPDPRPRTRDAKRRLTHPRFLEMYQRILKKGGTLHLKTDNDNLYDYTIEVLSEYPNQNLLLTRDLHNSPLASVHHGIKTRYEKRAVNYGWKINYLQFQFV